jgi:thiol-disulfide isomerase/thioredoxin
VRASALYGVTGGLIAVAVTLGLATAAGLVWRQRNGVLRPTRPQAPSPRASQGEAARPDLTSEDLGAPLGARATLLQFSSAFCAPCRATRRVLAEVAAMTDGIAHVEIDAESHLDLVRRLDVRRTPTVFVLGPDGRIARRASGQPRTADVIAALGEVT